MNQRQAVRCLALVGATGAVGQEVIKILQQRRFPADEVRFFASSRSAGEKLEFGDREIKVEALKKDCFRGVEVAIFTAGGAISREWGPQAVQSGALVIDNSSAFRQQPDVPLVVPEVNPHALRQRPARGLIANPNCSTIQMVVVLKPLLERAGLKRVVVSTYQSVSGAGRRAIDELGGQVAALFNGQDPLCEVFPHRIAFNCLPQIGDFLPEGDTQEERKIVEETRKILEQPQLGVSATTVRVPVFVCHSESVNIELERPLSADEARQLLEKAPGVRVVDIPEKRLYPMLLEATGLDEVLVGRIRRDPSVPHGLNCWIVADNLRKGAALNAVQIAELYLRAGW